ncbi:MAG: type II toxin-antitoxin system VapC family toxin [Candidatus Levybacteria bacterium]|nr:type II toxin-antitoxin system VapC family toxin [Candidatus Levybacteria bacterium]
MRYLLDTHVFLWWLNKDKRLNPKIRDVIQDTKTDIFISVASGLEMSIKRKTKKLRMNTTIKRSFEISGFQILDIKLEHALQLERLPSYHGDPFDRILIAQSKVESLIFVTVDKTLYQYNTKFLKLKN